MLICVVITSLAALLLILLVVVAVKTAAFKSKQLIVDYKAAYAIDMDSAAGRLAGKSPAVSVLR